MTLAWEETMNRRKFLTAFSVIPVGLAGARFLNPVGSEETPTIFPRQEHSATTCDHLFRAVEPGEMRLIFSSDGTEELIRAQSEQRNGRLAFYGLSRRIGRIHLG
jgi:hypothetical protein